MERGITLIALIITIVVLLILAAVAISSITNDGILSYAQNAAKDYNQAVKNEQEMLQEYMNFLNNGGSVKEGTHNWTRNGDTLTCKCESCLLKSADGFALQIGQAVKYTDNGAGSSTLSGEMSGVSQGITDGVLTASDYGTDGAQTINKDSNTSWVVLGIKDKDSNGTNETLLLTSSTPTTQKLILYGGNPYYYNVDEELNRMCKEIYGENARSINADDVNATLEYTPEGGIYYGSNFGACIQIGNFTTKLSELTDNYHNVWNAPTKSILYNSSGAKRTNWYTPEYQSGTSDENNLGKYIVNGYWYLKDDTLNNPYILPVLPSTTSSVAKDIIFENEGYYLSNKGVGVYNISVCFGIRTGA